MTQITNIPLDDQVLAILRVWRTTSYMFRPSIDISNALEQPQHKVIHALVRLHDSGTVMRFTGTNTQYRVSTEGERTKGCCCCCNGKLFDASRLFCETCAPEFDGRI
jgi:hypothetical protein